MGFNESFIYYLRVAYIMLFAALCLRSLIGTQGLYNVVT